MGIDLTDRLLDRAREKALQQGLSNLEFQQADMENLGYPDGSFMLWSACSRSSSCRT